MIRLLHLGTEGRGTCGCLFDEPGLRDLGGGAAIEAPFGWREEGKMGG